MPYDTGRITIIQTTEQLLHIQMDSKKIQAIESQLIQERPWQLKGEVTGSTRPLNSLLLEDVRFERHTKECIPETTESLEEKIKLRIKDNRFDDPVKKVKPASMSAHPSSSVEVSSERSKVGLATLYEQEIVSKTAAAQETKDTSEKKVEIKLWSLFRKLDHLIS